MRSIVAWSLRYRLLALGIALAVMVVGAVQLPNMPVTVVPEFSPPYVEVQTEALGLSAEEVEQLITVPIEADLLHGVAWLDEIRSESVAGLSSIVMLFEPGTDVIRARQMVAERLTQAHFLPNVSKAPTMLQPLSSTSRVQMVGLRSTGLTPIEMSVLARWSIRPRLMGIPGVANVAIWGQRERQLQVQVDPQRLNAAGVTLQDVIETTGNALWFSPLTFLDASTPGTGGFIDTPNQRLTVQHILPIRTPEDLAAVTFENPAEDGATIALGDVANVVEDHQPLIGDAVVDGGPGLLLLVERFPDADVREVTHGVEEALAAMAPGLAGMEIDTDVYRPAEFIDAAFANVSLALMLALVLVSAALFLILFDWRAALVALLTMPVAITAAAVVLYLTGQSMNVIVLSGLLLAVGVIVDDAVVGVDTIARRLREPNAEDALRSRTEIVLDAALEGRGAIVFASLIVLFAVVPLLFVTGIAGTFMPQLALAYALAIIASMVVAVTLAPALAFALLRTGGMRRPSPVAGRLERVYGRALGPILNRVRPALAVLVLVVLAAGTLGLAVVASNGSSSFMPELREGDLVIRWNNSPGTSHPQMSQDLTAATQQLQRTEGVLAASAHVGRAVLGDRVVGINSGEIWVSLDPAADYAATTSRVNAVANLYPGLAQGVVTYPSSRVDEVVAAPEPDAYVRIYGRTTEQLQVQAGSVQQALTGLPGVAAATVEPLVFEDTIEIEVDLAAAAAAGLKPGDVRRSAAALLSGFEVGALFEEQKVFDVVVWGIPEIRSSAAAVGQLLIDTPSGELVPLSQVAEVRTIPRLSEIHREGVMRKLDVQIDLAGMDTAAAIRGIESALGSVAFPLEYHAEVFSPQLAREGALTSLALASLAAALGILLLLQAALGSWRLAVMFLLMLPAALIGGVLAALVLGGITIAAVGGLLTVLAITARNAITSADHYQRALLANGEAERDILVRVARERLAPIVLTALATAAAVVPFALLGARPGYEILGPTAVVVIAGLVTSTLANLFIVPTLFRQVGPSQEPETMADPAPRFRDRRAATPA